MKITVAKSAGFCPGVEKATSLVEAAVAKNDGRARLFTVGTLIHNETYNRSLAERGVKITSVDECGALAESAKEGDEVTVFVRAHGLPVEEERKLFSLAEKYPYFHVEDGTCAFVRKIHRICDENDAPDAVLFVFGNPDHPEVKGILSHFSGEKYVFSSADELVKILTERKNDPEKAKKRVIAVSQTTQKTSEWKKSQENFKNLCTNPLIFDTICSVTEKRQKEAEELSRVCDRMVVVGGRQSSNTAKLFAVCQANCPDTCWIEEPSELAGVWNTSPCTSAGITAGASTPSGLIQEVVRTMSEMENFEQMLEESLKPINIGETVVGTVAAITDQELQLDLGGPVTGIIRADQITHDTSAKLSEMFKIGDEVKGFVIRVSDVEGVAELSKLRVDSDEEWQNVVDAKEGGAIVSGKVTDVVKGGVVVSVGANRVFVPASQTDVPKDGDLETLRGETVKLKIIEIKDKKRAVGSIRAVAQAERKAAREAFWETIEEGKFYTGPVKNMTDFGAFVDLGGVDGMVHKTELSWKPIGKPSDVLTIGQEITVFVKSFDREKKRISLGYKTEDTNPWNAFIAQYQVGDVASVKIVSMTPFGAFAEIVDGVDGLIHISQIADRRISKPAEVLSIGQVVDAKIIAIDEENRKISLSIRALLEEVAPVEGEYADEAAPAEEAAPADAE